MNDKQTKTVRRISLALIISLLLTIFFATFDTSVANAQQIAVKFQDISWYKIIEKAQEENKLIFVDACADYCPPCKVMDAQVFPNKSVALFFNENFVSYKLDIESKENTYFKELYNIKTVPTLLFMNADGKLIKKVENAEDASGLLQLGREIIQTKSSFIVKVSNDPKWTRLIQLAGSHENKKLTQPKLLKEYALLLRKYRKPYNVIVNEYLKTQARNMRSKENRKFIYDFTTNLENQSINYFIKDIEHYKQNFGGKKVNEKIKTAIYNSILASIRERDFPLFLKAQTTATQIALPDADTFLFEMESLFYQGIEDWENYAEIANKYLNSKEITDPQLLNDVASKFHKYVNTKKDVKQALKWIKKSMKIENEYYNNATYAALLYKIGKTKKAIKAAEKAIHIAKLRKKYDYQETLRMLDRMKSSQQRTSALR